MLDVSALTLLAWEPVPGDGSPLGWLTIGMYTLAAGLIAIAATHRSSGRRLLVLLSIALIVLGLIKRFDLLSIFGDEIRRIALDQAWYADRRPGQVVAMVVMSLLATVVTIWMCRRTHRPMRPIVLLIALLMTFVACRAISLHHIEDVLRLGPQWINVNQMVELSLLGALAWVGVRYGRHWHVLPADRITPIR